MDDVAKARAIAIDLFGEAFLADIHNVLDEGVGVRECDKLQTMFEKRILAAIAQARRAGAEAMREVAASYVERLTEKQSTIRRHQTATILRTLPLPGDGGNDGK